MVFVKDSNGPTEAAQSPVTKYNLLRKGRSPEQKLTIYLSGKSWKSKFWGSFAMNISSKRTRMPERCTPGVLRKKRIMHHPPGWREIQD